jgi:hypothetical protein
MLLRKDRLLALGSRVVEANCVCPPEPAARRYAAVEHS